MITIDFNRIDFSPGDRILDIGCGSGRHTAAVYQHPGVLVIGVDLNIDDLRQAKERLLFHDKLGEHEGGSWFLSVSDVTCLPFNDNSFDLVICSEVLEHIRDEEKAVQEIVRVLKPGKTLAVSVPRFFSEYICWTLSDRYHDKPGDHVRIYRKHQLIRLLEKKGVVYRSSSFAHSLHSPYWWLKCMVGIERTDSFLVNSYNRFLTWDIMKKPKLTCFLDRLLNPLLGKSLVVYGKKR